MVTKSIPIYQVDAFADQIFQGNPAAICFMEDLLPDRTLQSIAAENNLAETAFIWNHGDTFSIRWFTPTVEVDLCGHATLASAFVLFNINPALGRSVTFDSKSGPLFVTKGDDDLLILDFPRDQYAQAECPPFLEVALGTQVIDCIKGKSDYLVRIDNEKSLEDLKPDFSMIRTLKSRGLIVTARGNEVDFVSRCFFPQSGIDEDPVTGSAHTTLIPYWSDLLHKNEFLARQISPRGGALYCTLKDQRVLIGGHAQLYLEGKIYISGN